MDFETHNLDPRQICVGLYAELSLVEKPTIFESGFSINPTINQGGFSLIGRNRVWVWPPINMSQHLGRLSIVHSAVMQCSGPIYMINFNFRPLIRPVIY